MNNNRKYFKTVPISQVPQLAALVLFWWLARLEQMPGLRFLQQTSMGNKILQTAASFFSNIWRIWLQYQNPGANLIAR